MTSTAARDRMPTTTSQVRLASRPVGEPVRSDFEVVSAPLSALAEGEVLLRTIYLSLDPYMRGRLSDAKSYAKPVPLGGVIVGGTVCEVVASRAPDRLPGDLVLAYTGWQTYAVVPATSTRPLDPSVAPISTALGVLGMPGFTAYAGLLEIGRPRPGETVVVAAATGPVGSAVGQIARIKGSRAVGIASGADKCRMLPDVLGFDAAVDRRSPTFVEDLAAATPDGVDVYFENVGGAVSDAVVRRFNQGGRMPVCGLVSGYNATSAPSGPDELPGFLRRILTLSLTVRGFTQDEFVPTLREPFAADMRGWLAEGRVAYREDIVDGLENAPEAFAGMLTGRYAGKVLIRVSPDPTR